MADQDDDSLFTDEDSLFHEEDDPDSHPFTEQAAPASPPDAAVAPEPKQRTLDEELTMKLVCIPGTIQKGQPYPGNPEMIVEDVSAGVVKLSYKPPVKTKAAAPLPPLGPNVARATDAATKAMEYRIEKVLPGVSINEEGRVGATLIELGPKGIAPDSKLTMTGDVISPDGKLKMDMNAETLQASYYRCGIEPPGEKLMLCLRNENYEGWKLVAHVRFVSI